LLIVSSVIVLFVAVVVGLQQWQQAGETALIIDWPLNERQNSTITVDGRKVNLAKHKRLRFRGPPGKRQLHLTREGYQPIEQEWDLTRGQVIEFKPDWKPNADTIRKRELTVLQSRVSKYLDAFRGVNPPGTDNGDQPRRSPVDPLVVELRNDLVDFRRKHPGSPEAIGTAKEMSRLPWPADNLKRDDIDPYELKIAGHGNPANAPSELVAVLGDSRLKHSGKIYSVAYGKDGHTIASSSLGLVSLWDAETGELVRQFVGHKFAAPVACVAYSRDGQKLVSAGHDGSLTVWNVATGEEFLWFNGHKSKVSCCAISPDGTTVASGTIGSMANHHVKLWHIASGKELRTLGSQMASIKAVAFSPDGKTLATASDDATVKLWDVQSGKELHSFEDHSEAVLSVAFSPDGTTLATAGDKRVILWNLESGEQRSMFQPGTHLVQDVSFSSNGKLLACGVADYTVNKK
jgi:WD40 repeat protein